MSLLAVLSMVSSMPSCVTFGMDDTKAVPAYDAHVDPVDVLQAFFGDHRLGDFRLKQHCPRP